MFQTMLGTLLWFSFKVLIGVLFDWCMMFVLYCVNDFFTLFLQEYKACNLEACPEVKRNTPWTPWMPVNVTQGGARQEQRVRYMCRAHLSDPHELQIGRRKVETRFCPNDGTAVCETDSKSNVVVGLWCLCFIEGINSLDLMKRLCF